MFNVVESFLYPMLFRYFAPSFDKQRFLIIFVRFRWKASGAFTPPVEREEYIQAKSKSDLKDPLAKDNLRKLLTKRALKAIPIIISLQNEGQSIDRLYKKGMLTDDMHFRVKELKAFVDQEYQDVQSEANDLLEGWGEHVWQQAMQYHTVRL